MNSATLDPNPTTEAVHSAGEAAVRSLRIVILEDVAADAELVQRMLLDAEIDFSAEQVTTKEDFAAALRDAPPDLILSDYSLPSFDGLAALRMAQHACPDVPFVFVSGALGEELAIETVKNGATDYVLKQRLSRLVPAVRRALAEAAERSARRQAQRALRRSEEKHRALLEINNAIISNLDRQTLFAAITSALHHVIPFDAMSLALYDAESDALIIVALEGAELAAKLEVGTAIPRKGSHVGWVTDNGRYLLRDDLSKAREFFTDDMLHEAGLSTYVAAPLVVKKKTLGTLNMASKTPGRYDEDDATFLTEVANLVAQAIANMLAYEEIAELKSQLERENLYLHEEIKTHHEFEEIVGQSKVILKMLKGVETVAPTDATVLICGETGTGKELVARAVHKLSAKAGKPFVAVNCAALPTNLIESELFGHERGAFTGAVSRKLGRFELANGGTIFLDEVGDLPLELQAKLLRVLQEGEFERVGGSQTIKVDVRVIAATNRNLDEAMQEERFRSDLYYRLNVFPIMVPPLRDRREDIPSLVSHFALKCTAKLGRQVGSLSKRTMADLKTYDWPGNVRELENVVERAAILSRGSELEFGEWRPQSRAGAPTGSTVATLDDLQRQHILEVLELTGWRVSGDHGAANILGIKPTTLEARMKKLGIERKQYRRQ